MKRARQDLEKVPYRTSIPPQTFNPPTTPNSSLRQRDSIPLSLSLESPPLQFHHKRSITTTSRPHSAQTPAQRDRLSPTDTMPYLPTSQAFLEQSALLLQAYPETVRGSSEFHVECTPHRIHRYTRTTFTPTQFPDKITPTISRSQFKQTHQSLSISTKKGNRIKANNPRPA